MITDFVLPVGYSMNLICVTLSAWVLYRIFAGGDIVYKRCKRNRSIHTRALHVGLRLIQLCFGSYNYAFPWHPSQSTKRQTTYTHAHTRTHTRTQSSQGYLYHPSQCREPAQEGSAPILQLIALIRTQRDWLCFSVSSHSP